MARTKKPGPRRPYAPLPPPPKLSPLETIELELAGTEMTMRNAKSLRDKRLAWLIKELQHDLDFAGTVDDNRARDLAEVIALDERIAAQQAHVASLRTVLAAAQEMRAPADPARFVGRAVLGSGFTAADAKTVLDAFAYFGALDARMRIRDCMLGLVGALETGPTEAEKK